MLIPPQSTYGCRFGHRHRDLAFYSPTNDDLAAVGIMLDGCTLENGPMVLSHGHSLRYPGDGAVPSLATGRTGSVSQVHRRERHFTQR